MDSCLVTGPRIASGAPSWQHVEVTVDNIKSATVLFFSATVSDDEGFFLLLLRNDTEYI